MPPSYSNISSNACRLSQLRGHSALHRRSGVRSKAAPVVGVQTRCFVCGPTTGVASRKGDRSTVEQAPPEGGPGSGAEPADSKRGELKTPPRLQLVPRDQRQHRRTRLTRHHHHKRAQTSQGCCLREWMRSPPGPDRVPRPDDHRRIPLQTEEHLRLEHVPRQAPRCSVRAGSQDRPAGSRDHLSSGARRSGAHDVVLVEGPDAGPAHVSAAVGQVTPWSAWPRITSASSTGG